MALLNFQAQFVPRIEIGLRDPGAPLAKTHTIRAPRADGRDPKPGDTLYLYTGLRQKGARRIGLAKCTRVESIVIKAKAYMPFFDARMRSPHPEGKPVAWSIHIGPMIENANQDTRANAMAFPDRYNLVRLFDNEAALLAIADGFANFAEMMAFWKGRLPFFGYIIHWRRIEVRVSGGEKPLTAKTQRALQDVAEAAYAHVSNRMRRRKER